MDSQTTQLIDEIKLHLDDPEFLSNAIIRLSAINYEVGKLMAEAKFNESKSATDYMNSTLFGEKRMAVSEAEKRAIVETNNDYELAKNQHDDIAELVNSLKIRVNVLSWERRN